MRRIIRLHWSDSPTIGVSDYPVTLCFSCFLVVLVQLVGLSLLFHCDLISLRWVGHLVSTVHWTSRLDGAMDVSEIAWTLSKGHKESYKYDLANSLVPLKTSPIDCVVTRSPKSLEMA